MTKQGVRYNLSHHPGRYWLVAGLAALLMAAFVAKRLAHGSSSDFVCLDPKPLESAIASFAMNTHLQQGWQYEDAPKTIKALQELGITQIREAFPGLGNEEVEYAAKNGMRFLFFVGPNMGPDLIASLEAWETKYPRSIIGIEGPNEVNNWPVEFDGKKGIPAAQAFQQWLYDAVKASPILRSIPVLALTSWPVFYNKADIGNIHAYSRTGQYLYPNIEDAIEEETRKNPPPKTVWLTEGGYHTHLGEDYDEGVSENTQAKLVTSMYLDALALGVQKTFGYQLLDQYEDPQDEQSHFGLVDRSWRRKPAFHALRLMIEALEEAQGPLVSQLSMQPVWLKLDGLPDTARHLLLQSSPTSYVLAVWNEPPVWDAIQNVEMHTSPSTVSISLKQPATSMHLVALDNSGTAGPSLGRTDFTFALSDYPILVVLDGLKNGCPG